MSYLIKSDTREQKDGVQGTVEIKDAVKPNGAGSVRRLRDLPKQPAREKVDRPQVACVRPQRS